MMLRLHLCRQCIWKLIRLVSIRKSVHYAFSNRRVHDVDLLETQMLAPMYPAGVTEPSSKLIAKVLHPALL